jgi:hypothetical protein
VGFLILSRVSITLFVETRKKYGRSMLRLNSLFIYKEIYLDKKLDRNKIIFTATSRQGALMAKNNH